MGFAAGAVLLILGLSAVLTAAHDAAFQIGTSRLRTLVEEGFDGADALTEVRTLEHTVQASVRIVTLLLDLLALSIMAITGVSTWGVGPRWVSVAVGVLIVVIVAELIPHLLAARRPVRLALTSAPMLLMVERLARPVTAPVERLEDRIGNNGDGLTDEQRELREIQELGEEEGVLEAGENLLVERAFRLDELTAWDVMVPRVDIFAWKTEQTLGDVVGDLPSVPYSRIPVYRESVDDVTGIVYVREAYARFVHGDRDITLGELAREPFFVPGSLSLTQLLQDFQVRRIHMGIVADEFGGTDGLVTLEDILEELVGEIVDETDVEEEAIVRISESVVECAGAVDIRDLEEALGASLPETDHRSLNGFVLDELGHVPAEGEVIGRDGVRIEILEASETQVLRAKLLRVETDEEDETESAGISAE